jgi:hypothetical protein
MTDATRARIHQDIARHFAGLALIRAYFAQHPNATLEEAHAAVVRQAQESEKQS